MKNILIIGATSAIASETARCFAREGATLVICGRNLEKLERLAADLKVRGASAVHCIQFDALESSSYESLVRDAIEKCGELDAALIAHGSLPDQKQCEESSDLTLEALAANFLSPVLLLTALGVYFETRRQGNITVIASVAGDRGRQSNYVYGSAKGGLDIFLEGLRNRLFHFGVSVTTIKPGFVDTPMTAHIKKGPLFASPNKVGARIHKAMKRGEEVVYTPWFWWPIMTVIRNIPERVFKRLRM